MAMPCAIVLGVGAENGLGAALSRRFAREGHHVYVAGRTHERLQLTVEAIRSSGGSAEAVVADATSEQDVRNLFNLAFAPQSTFEPPDLVVFNAGANKRMRFANLTAQAFEDYWRGGCFAGFLVGKEAIVNLLPLRRGTLILTGASASLRGKAGFGHFAASKAGLRMVGQSLAREFGPEGIHVAHVVVDGGIDGERLRTMAPSLVSERGDAGLLDIDAIAENYWNLHRQPPSAWTQELDLRPHLEQY